MTIKVTESSSITRSALAWAAAQGCKPMRVAVLDAGGHLISLAREDGASNMRPQLAIGDETWALHALGAAGLRAVK